MKTEYKPLKDLKKGDYFFSMSDKKRVNRYQVVGDPQFNLRAGSPTRNCYNMTTRQVESKLCRVSIVHVMFNQ